MYQCKACNFKGKLFPNGACPGCDSRNISRITNTTDNTDVAKKSTLKSKLILVGVWGLFAYAVYDLFQK